MDLKEIKRIIHMVEDANIASLSLEVDGMRIDITKQASSAPAAQVIQSVVADPTPAAPAPVPVAAPDPSPAAVPPATVNGVPVTSPMVGTFYASPNPDSPPFVKVGDRVKKGQVLCIIEAMKLFNEIESEVDGVIEQVLVDNAEAVEYGQDLFVISQG